MMTDIIEPSNQDLGDSPEAVVNYIYSLENRITELEKLIEKVISNAKEVRATDKNTQSVRNKFEMGGYVKHYILPRQIFNMLKAKNQ